MPDQFLLDANLSPKIVRVLSRDLGIDIRSVFKTHPHDLPDPEVMRLANKENRVVITADHDYVDLFFSMRRLHVSVIFLDLHGEHRRVPALIQRLSLFFQESAPSLTFDSILVTISEHEIRVDEGWKIIPGAL